MRELPDGSGFFTATVGGPRPKGFISVLKYTKKKAYARRWLFLWRNYVTAYTLSRVPGQGPPLSVWRALKWALSVSF